MDSKIVATVIISVILGTGLGLGLSYIMVQSEIRNLESRINAIENQSWHLVYGYHNDTEANSNNLNSTAFEIKGRSMRVRWYMQSDVSYLTINYPGCIQITIFHQNGNPIDRLYSSGAFGSYSNEIEIKETGMYFVNIETTSTVTLYSVYIYDYY